MPLQQAAGPSIWAVPPVSTIPAADDVPPLLTKLLLQLQNFIVAQIQPNCVAVNDFSQRLADGMEDVPAPYILILANTDPSAQPQ